MLSCLSCKHCKVNLNMSLLYCKKHRWIHHKGKERKVRLTKAELKFPGEHIRYRDLFDTVKLCKQAGIYEGMDD